MDAPDKNPAPRKPQRIAEQYCITVLPIESIPQYRFATPNPLKTRRAADCCETAPLCNHGRHQTNMDCKGLWLAAGRCFIRVSPSTTCERWNFLDPF